MSNKPKVYLAGPITGLSYEDATQWRKCAADWLKDFDIEALDPMRQKEHLASVKSIDNALNDDKFLTTQKAIITRDRFDVLNCDAILMYLKGAKAVGVGTCVELGWSDLLRKPVVAVIEPKGNPYDKVFFQALANFRCETLADAVDILASILNKR